MIGAAHLPAPANTDASFPGARAVNRAGCTENFEIFYDRNLGETGRLTSAVVLNRAERDLAYIRDVFGELASPADRFTVVLVQFGSGGAAYHLMGDTSTLFCSVSTTPQLEALQSSFFLTLLLADIYASSAGWDRQIGNALARVLATSLYPRRIAGYATAWMWLEGDREDFISHRAPNTEPGTGCSVLFLNYLHYQLGFLWREIAAIPAPTLGVVGSRLTGTPNAFAPFQSLLNQHRPLGERAPQRNDNPFPLNGDRADSHHATTSRRELGESERGTGRVCLLTGASGKLGNYLLEHYADRYQFSAIYHRTRPRSAALPLEADLTIDGEAERVVELTLARFGRIDMVVNAAVASTWGPMLESEALLESAHTQFLTNVVAPLKISCTAARLFWRGRSDENRSERRNVVNVSSVSGLHVYPDEGQSVYAASKAALDHLTGHMALEFASIGVRVNAIAPNSFPSNVATSRAAGALAALDEGTNTGAIVVVDGSTDQVIQLIPALAQAPDQVS